MSLGYMGYAELMVDAITDVLLCTGASVPESRMRLESSSGYGGEIKTPVNEMGIALPRNYDWSTLDGSIDFEVHQDLFTNQLYPWIFDRQSAAYVRLRTRAGSDQQFNTVYWNNITLSASDGAALTGSVGFVALERNAYTIGGDYIANKEGSGFLCDPGVLSVPGALNPSADSQRNPIPFWRTWVVINGSLRTFSTWSVDLSQEVVKFFACEHNASPQEPKYLAVGPMTVTFTGDYVSADTFGFTAPDTLTDLYIHMADEVLKLADLELTTGTDAVAGQSDPVPLAVEYAAYELVA